LILAQGLFYALKHLLTGVLLAVVGGDPHELWADVRHLLLLQGVQFIALVAGGILAGGGQRHGFILGTVVGAWNGVLAVLLHQIPAQELNLIGLYGQPLLHATFAAIGGWIGSVIWAPIPLAPVPIVLTPPRKAAKKRKVSPFAGRVFWFRVVSGSAFAVAGTLSATLILQKVLDMSGGKLALSHELQDRLITWELKALAVLFGGALAGATTPNGLKQGLFVGFGASMVLIAVQAPTTASWWMFAFFTLVSTFSLSLVGGWFGGQLFPPIIKMERSRDFGMPSW
jgi:hypothetical protein